MISLPQQSGLSKVGCDLEFLSISQRKSSEAGAVWTCVREFSVRVTLRKGRKVKVCLNKVQVVRFRCRPDFEEVLSF